jgi:hypothetical protein
MKPNLSKQALCHAERSLFAWFWCAQADARCRICPTTVRRGVTVYHCVN